MSVMKFVAVFLAFGIGMSMDLSIRRARGSAAVSPMEKVITLLTDLKEQVTEEAKEEAKTYDEFACFCKDKTADKSDAITAGQTTIDDEGAIIEEETAKEQQENTKLTEFREKIQGVQDEIKVMEVRRAEEKVAYETAFADLEKALKSLEGAIEALKSAKPDLLAVKTTIRKSMIFADALSLIPSHQKTMNAFLQGSQDPGDYESQTGDISDVLKQLETDFTAHKDKKVSEEEQANSAHEKLVEEKREFLKIQEDGAAKAGEDIEACKKAVADSTEILIETEGELKDNKAYLQDLTSRCESKATQWDQRSKMRADEVTALTQAMEMIQGKNVKEVARALLQGKKQSALITQKEVLSQGSSSEGAGAGEDDVGGSALSFLQRESPRPALHALLKGHPASETGAPKDARAKAIAVLASEGKRLGSTVLTSVASQIAADPFKKVKQLIQTLIERMLTEAADEATHKGFCDEELGKAKTARGFQLAKSEKLNAELMELEVKKRTAQETIDTLTSELEDLYATLEKATKMRGEEKDENAEGIKSAKEGAEAVTEAIKILKEFYKGAKALLQASPVDADPDVKSAGFDGAYEGNQGAAGGIIGMLEVIKSDFERAVKQTEDAEANSHRGFVKLERQTKTSISSKETGKAQGESDITNAGINIDESTVDLEETQKLLDKTLLELEELKPACIDTGMSYAERVKAREDEIGALKKALEILQPSP